MHVALWILRRLVARKSCHDGAQTPSSWGRWISSWINSTDWWSRHLLAAPRRITPIVDLGTDMSNSIWLSLSSFHLSISLVAMALISIRRDMLALLVATDDCKSIGTESQDSHGTTSTAWSVLTRSDKEQRVVRWRTRPSDSARWNCSSIGIPGYATNKRLSCFYNSAGTTTR